MADASELAGKVALVTGGAQIGRAICLALAAGGAAVLVNARSSRDEAEQTAALIKSAGGRAMTHFADVTDARAVAAMVEAALGEFGRLDMLVNNAAVRAEVPFAEMKLEDGAEWSRRCWTALSCARRLPAAYGARRRRCGGEHRRADGAHGAVGRAHVVAAKAGLAG